MLTVAPTGTISVLAGVSSGIEPVYEFSYKQTWRGGTDMVYHPLYKEWVELHPNEERPEYFVSANDLTPMEHTKVQAIAQDYIDSSISKTVNAPNSHTVEDVKNLYMTAYDMGLKGITYMRDGSRQGVFERIDEKKADEVKKEEVIKKPVERRPHVLFGATYKTETPFGHSFVTINSDQDNNPFEIFIASGRSGSDIMAMSEALGRIVSILLRMQSDVPHRERIKQVIGQLSGIGGARAVGFGVNRVRSLPDALAKVLGQHFGFKVNGRVVDTQQHLESKDEEVVANGANGNGHAIQAVHTPSGGDTIEGISMMQQMSISPSGATAVSVVSEERKMFDICPECGGASLAHEEGCKKCYGCGYSEC